MSGHATPWAQLRVYLSSLVSASLLPMVLKIRKPILHQMSTARTMFTGPNTQANTNRICGLEHILYYVPLLY